MEKLLFGDGWAFDLSGGPISSPSRFMNSFSTGGGDDWPFPDPNSKNGILLLVGGLVVGGMIAWAALK